MVAGIYVSHVNQAAICQNNSKREPRRERSTARKGTPIRSYGLWYSIRDQSINQSINRSTNQLKKPMINQLIFQSIDQAIYEALVLPASWTSRFLNMNFRSCWKDPYRFYAFSRNFVRSNFDISDDSSFLLEQYKNTPFYLQNSNIPDRLG